MERWKGLLFVIGVATMIISILTPGLTWLGTAAFLAGMIIVSQNWPFNW